MSVIILMYHAISPERNLITVTPRVFARQMAWLYNHHVQVLSLRDLAWSLAWSDPLPENAVVLTFDDGFQSLYDHALPVLNEYGFTATVFLVAGYCGGKNDWPGQPVGIPELSLLRWDQIREMASLGIEFGAHTKNHARLDNLSLEQSWQEVCDSKDMIEDKLGNPIGAFAYPYGRYTPQIKEQVSQIYQIACTTRLGLVTSASDPYSLERVEILYLEHPRLFAGMNQLWFPPYLGLRRTMRRIASRVLRREWY